MTTTTRTSTKASTTKASSAKTAAPKPTAPKTAPKAAPKNEANVKPAAAPAPAFEDAPQTQNVASTPLAAAIGKAIKGGEKRTGGGDLSTVFVVKGEYVTTGGGAVLQQQFAGKKSRWAVSTVDDLGNGVYVLRFKGYAAKWTEALELSAK